MLELITFVTGWEAGGAEKRNGNDWPLTRDG